MSYLSSTFTTAFCEGNIYQVSAHDLIVFGKINEVVKNNTVYYAAANPPDYRATYTGSGLPFANQSQAFENSPNRGSVVLINNTFEIKLMYPNSYYIGLGSVLVPPSVQLEYETIDGKQRTVTIKLSDGVPYRMLTYPSSYTLPRKDSMFYSFGWKMPVRTQEQILRDSAYPSINKMSGNFWGLKPPL